MKPLILIADDDDQIREILRIYFAKENFAITEATDGADAILKTQSLQPDLIILDLMMPVMDGFEVCKKVQQISNTPIIMLTARDEDDTRILGLEIGADDYITKPFNPKEVVARAKAVLRRANLKNKSTDNNEPQQIEFKGLTINLTDHTVVSFGEDVVLTAKEMELLWYFSQNPGKVFTRASLLETVWGYSYEGDTRTVDTHIKRLRHKLAIPENSSWDIKTVWGVGYKFEVL